MGDTNNDPNAKPEDNPKDLRAQLEAANKDKADLTARLNRLELDVKVRDEANLGHLSTRQRRTILRELQEDGTEFTPEAAQEVAKELGFSVEPPKPPTEPTQQQGEPQPNGQQEPQVNPTVDKSLGAFSAMEQANMSALRGNIDPSLEDEMKKTKTPDELTALIRKKGPASGIVHSWDVQ